MAEYIVDPLNADPDTLEEDGYAFLQTKWPAWLPSQSGLVSWMVKAGARMVAEAIDVGSDVPVELAKFIGANIHGVEPVGPTSSTVTSTWTYATNPDGRTIEAGTVVGIADGDDNLYHFEVVDDVVLAPSDLATDAGAVLLRSVDEGAETSNLGGTGVVVEPIDSVPGSPVITLTGTTVGGIDEEDPSDYLDRLTGRMTLLTPRPILPGDFQTLAIDIAAQNGVVARCAVLDGYDPGDSSFNNERMVTLALVVMDTGADIPDSLRSLIASELQALRELNFSVHVIDPTRTDVDVTVVGTSLRGYNPADVETSVELALQENLTGATWGSYNEAGEWINQTALRHQDVSAIVNNVAGFDYWTTLTTGLNGGAQSTTDKTLTGAVALPNPGDISVTVTAP